MKKERRGNEAPKLKPEEVSHEERRMRKDGGEETASPEKSPSAKNHEE